MTAEELMRHAIDAARRGIAIDQSPFGCAILDRHGVTTAAHNVVLRDVDITAHAEITALRAACRRSGEIHLSGAWVASTCEPCPMCMAALHWARVERVFYGASIEDAAAGGFHELHVPAADLLRLGGSEVVLQPGVLSDECKDLFFEWKRLPGHRAY